MTYERALSILASRGIYEPSVIVLARNDGISRMAAARQLLAASM